MATEPAPTGSILELELESTSVSPILGLASKSEPQLTSIYSIREPAHTNYLTADSLASTFNAPMFQRNSCHIELQE